MATFEIPDWAMAQPADAPPPPPPDPAMLREQQIADNTRAEQALNGFIAGKQAALFEAPDAFYRTQGEDAIHAAPVILDTLSRLRDDSLDGLGNDAQRDRLGTALDAHLQLARDDIARHVAEQSLTWQRQVAQDRIALLTKEAALHHNDDELVDAIGHAAANAARAHARMGDMPLGIDSENAAASTARSGVFNAAIQARFDRGNSGDAATMFDRLKDRLDPAHAEQLQARMVNESDPNIVLAQAGSGQPSMDQSAPAPGSVAAAADIATQSARPGVDNYGGRCAEAVINALNKEGYDVPNVPRGAKTMGPGLLGAGFEEVVPSTPLPPGSQELPDGYTPRIGDVIVIDNPTSSRNNGHTAIYNGTSWVSDTIQRHANPYGGGTSTISIYRHP